MKTMKILLALFLSASCVGGICAQEKPSAKRVKAVRLGRLWDAKGKPWTNAIVIVEGDRIRSVTTDAAAIPAGAQRRSAYVGSGCDDGARPRRGSVHGHRHA